MPPRRPTATRTGTPTSNTSMDALYYNAFKEYSARYGPKTAILLQVGKFYEMYDAIHAETLESRANVRDLAEICGGSPEPRPTEDPTLLRLFWGFPESALDRYERILVQAGYTVVVINQQRDAMGDVKGRDVAYVSSPGTYLEAADNTTATITNTDDRNTVGILVEAFAGARGKPMWSIATSAFDVSTGRCISTETVVSIIDGKPVLDTLEPFWAVYTPVEIIVWTRDVSREARDLSVAERSSARDLVLSESQVASWFTGFRGPIHIRALTKEDVTAAAARARTDFLHRLFKPEAALSTADYLGLARLPTAFQCLARLLQFIDDHNPSFLQRLHDHTVWAPEDELLLGNAALQQLAMLPAAAKPAECLLYWLQKARTAVGRRTLRERCLKPLTDIAVLEERQDRIAALRDHPHARAMDCQLQGIQDLARLYRKCALGRGTVATDLTQILVAYERMQRLVEWTAGQPSAADPALILYLQQELDTWRLDRIRACTTDSALCLGPHHPWRRGLHPALDAYEDAWCVQDAAMRALKQEWESMMGEEGCLKVEFHSEEGRYTVSTTKRRATALAAVLKTRRREDLRIVTRGTSTTVQVEAGALDALNQAMLDVWPAWVKEAKDVWSATVFDVAKQEAVLDWLGCLDTELALARVANEYGYVRPVYETQTGTAGVSFVDLRHPILERVHTATPYIPHSLALGCFADTAAQTQAHAEHGILLYGVNAAGKSSLSKAIGLSVVLAQCGIPVPATQMRIAPYSALFTRILGNDNLWAGMSSFVVEMTEFRSILRSAGPQTLVLGDELCAGTETVSAISIVAAGIQTLVQKGTQFVFATHLHELMTIPEIVGLSTVVPYHLTVVADPRGIQRLVYDRQLKRGAGSPMYGLEVCRGLDMDPDFLQAALHFRKRLEGGTSEGAVSRYNARLSVRVCEVCGGKEALETHHIVPQQAADARGFIGVGVHKNHMGNLVVLCGDCHDKHHAGERIIRGWVQTSVGRMLDVEEADSDIVED